MSEPAGPERFAAINLAMREAGFTPREPDHGLSESVARATLRRMRQRFARGQRPRATRAERRDARELQRARPFEPMPIRAAGSDPSLAVCCPTCAAGPEARCRTVKTGAPTPIHLARRSLASPGWRGSVA